MCRTECETDLLGRVGKTALAAPFQEERAYHCAKAKSNKEALWRLSTPVWPVYPYFIHEMVNICESLVPFQDIPRVCSGRVDFDHFVARYC